ncbi:MAG TPA: 5'-nucleotidase C-terminal domain-containing protein [Pyrinomonadaceae bacterium]|nr:5'-nucleotidase C-terminal domain-containing protein [Pyrinomonadaceae bacterium]
MKKSARKTGGRVALPLFLLLWLSLSAAAVSAQPAAKTSPPVKPQPQAPAPTTRGLPARVTETLVDSSIPSDPGVDKILAAYSPKVRELEVVVGKLRGELKKEGMGAGSLGNFVADGMRSQASLKLGQPIDLAVMNGGGLRRNVIGEGELRARDIFELLPFENALVTLELTGEQVMKLLGVVVSGREAQSGARITYIIKADKSAELESAKLLDKDRHEREIDPKATYRVVTIDYLINVGGARYAILREGKNARPLGVTLRDAIIAYVKSETAAGRDIEPNVDGRFVLDRVKSVLSGEAPRQ